MYDISPRILVTGGFEAEETDDAARMIERIHALLAEGRFIAAVRHDAQDPDRGGEVGFTLVCDDEQRVLRVDEGGEVVPGDTLAETEQMLAGELGREVWLSPQFEDDDEDCCPCCDGEVDSGADVDDAADVEARLSVELEDMIRDLGPLDDAVVSITENGEEIILTRSSWDVADDETGDEWEDDEDDEGWDDEEGDRVLLFSRRGPSMAGLLSLLARTPVEAGALDGWSVFRYDGGGLAELPEATRHELPSIEVIAPGTPGAWIDVKTPAVRGGDEHFISPTASEHMRGVLDDSVLLGPDAALLSAVTINDHLRHDSELSKLLADPSLDADADALLVAFDAGFPGSATDRLLTALSALGVPAELARAAVLGDPLPGQRMYGDDGMWSTLVRIAEDGSAGMRPLGKRPSLLGRVEDAVRRNPRLSYAVAAVEAGLGAAAVVAGSRARGPRRLFGVIGGAVLISDAVIDALLAVRRSRTSESGK